MDTAVQNPEQRQVEDILGNGITLPPQPKILVDMERLVGQPNANVGDIAKLVGQDAGLTAAVFKIIHSPAYRTAKKIESLEQAISVIGLQQMANIIKSAALRRSLGGKEPFYEYFWEHSAEIAQLSSIIAWKLRSVCNVFPDQAYMAGLFHDCGLPILMQRFPDYCRSFRQGQGCQLPALQEEDRRFNTDHSVVGHLVARHWQLPDFICQAVRFHHDILHTEHKATTMVAILQMAAHIHNTYGQRDDTEWYQCKDRVLEELGLGADGLKEFEEDVYDSFKHP